MNISQKVEGLIADSLFNKGYAVVRVQMSGGDHRRTLQIMIERLDGESITVNDCSEASYTISALLDVEDVLKSHYILEVSSPGLDRPLVKLVDYQRFIGKLIVVKTMQAINNRKNFLGRLESIKGMIITIKLESPSLKEDTVVDLEYDNIQSARLQEESDNCI